MLNVDNILLDYFTQAHFFQGYEGSLLKVTSKNGKTASPVGFVTFNSRAGADAAKQDLQVRKPQVHLFSTQICKTAT